MYKIIGLFLTLCASWAFLYSKGQIIDKRYTNLKEMIKALTYLKQEISFSAGELGMVCKKVSHVTQGDVSAVFYEIVNILEENPSDFSSAWAAATDGKMMFSREAEMLLCDLAQNLGKKSLDIELENVQKAKEVLEQLKEHEKIKSAKDKKLLYTLGVSAGFALVILVI